MRPTVEQLEPRCVLSAPGAPDFVHVPLTVALQSWDASGPVLEEGPVEVWDFGHPGWFVEEPGTFWTVAPCYPVAGVWDVFRNRDGIDTVTYVRLNLTDVQTVGLLLDQSGLSLLVQQPGRVVRSASWDGGESWGAWQTVAEWGTSPVGGPAPAGAALPFWSVGMLDSDVEPHHVGTFATTATPEGVEVRWSWLDGDEVAQAVATFHDDGTVTDVRREAVDQAFAELFETEAEYLWS